MTHPRAGRLGTRDRRRGRTLAALTGAAAGATVAAVLLALAGSAVAHRLDRADKPPGDLIEATHLPPLLTAPGDPTELRYDIYCAAPDGDPESGAPCDAGGTVYVRPGDSGPFQALPLRLDASASTGRYVAELPESVSRAPAGFSYYAVLRNQRSGATTTLPPAGALAPQRSRPLSAPVAIRLGTHVFGAARRASARVAAAAWGGGPDEVGLEQGPQLGPIGASSFDVDATGAVVVLDEANRRALRFERPGRGPRILPLDVRGTIADLALEADGGIDVLETVAERGETPLVRAFDAQGRARGAWHIAGANASAVRAGPDGPVALQYPAGQWTPVVEHGRGLTVDEQRRRGRAGRPLPGGDELVVQRVGREARVAIVGRQGVRRSWQIESDTPLAEIQLAEPLGSRVVLVMRVYTEARDEFEVLVLDGSGVASRFAVDAPAWAETAPLARFRLRGSALYALGSTPAGMFVDRYDLEVS